MQSKTALALLAAVAYPLVFGCSSSGSADRTVATSSSAALRRTQSCEDLTLALREGRALEAESTHRRGSSGDSRWLSQLLPRWAAADRPGPASAGSERWSK